MERLRQDSEFVERQRHTVTVMVLAAALAVLATYEHLPSAQAAQHSSAKAALAKPYFTFGMTKKQVQRIVGRPHTIRGAWSYYPVVHGKIASKVPVAIDNVVLPADQFRLRFYVGQLQGEEVHIKVSGKGYIWHGITL
jgi:hypothetical protein